MHGASFLVTRDRSPPQIGFLAPLPARSEMSECAITLRRQGEVKTGEKKEKGKTQQERPCIPRRGKIRLESAGDPLGCDAEAGRCRDPWLYSSPQRRLVSFPRLHPGWVC